MTNNPLETMTQGVQEALDPSQTETQESVEQKEVGEAIDDISNQLNKLKGSLEEKRDIVSNHFKSVIEGLKGLDNQGRIESIYNKVESGNSIEEADIQQTIEALDAIKQNKESLRTSEIQKLRELSKQELEGLRAEVTQGVQKTKNLKENLLSKAENASFLGIGIFSVGGMVKDIINYMEKKYSGGESSESDSGFLSKLGLDFNFDKIGFSIKMGMLSFVAPELYKQLQNYEKLLSGGSTEVTDGGQDGGLDSRLEEEKKEELKSTMKENFYKEVKNITGKDISEEKFNNVFDSWFDKYLKEGQSLSEKKIKKVKEALEGEGDVYILKEMVDLNIFSTKAFFDLVFRLADKNIIDYNDIFLNAVKEGGQTFINFGIGSAGIFYNALGLPLGQTSLEGFKEYVNELNIDSNSRMALWGLLYRHGGIFTTIISNIAYLGGYGFSYLFGQGGDDVSKIQAFIKGGGVWDDFKKEISTFKQLQDSLTEGTNMEKKFPANKIWQDMDDFRKNIGLYHAAKNSTNYQEFKGLLEKYNLSGEYTDEFFKNNIGNIDNFGHFKRNLGSHIRGQSKTIAGNIDNNFGDWGKTISQNLDYPWAKSFHFGNISSNIKNQGEIMSNMLQNDKMFNKVKNFLSKYSKGDLNVEHINSSEKLKFYLRDIETANQFGEDLKILARQSPDILKFLFRSAPLIAVGGEVLNSFEKQDESVLSGIGKGIAYITPIIGPVALVNDSLAFGETTEMKPGQAALGGVLFGVDGYFLMRSIKSGDSLMKAMAQPTLDMAKLVRNVAWDAPKVGYKFARGGARIVAAGESRALGKEMMSGLRRVGLRGATIGAVLLALGYTAEQLLNSDEIPEKDKKIIEKLKEGGNKEIEKYVRENWKNFDDKQKEIVIKYAVSNSSGLSSNLLSVNYDSNSSKFYVELDELIPENIYKNLDQRLESALPSLEDKDTKVDFAITSNAIQKLHESFGKDKNKLRDYLAESGYDNTTIDSFMNRVV